MCRSMVDIQSPTAEIRRGKKRRKKKKKKIESNYRMKILWSALLHRATITSKLNIGAVAVPVLCRFIGAAVTSNGPPLCYGTVDHVCPVYL